MSEPGSHQPSPPRVAKGEDVMQTLYAKACADRDALAATNSLYSKMLEACAEQNLAAERAIAAARKEAMSEHEAAVEAIDARDQAVIQLQRGSAEAAERVAQLEASHAAASARETERRFAFQAEQSAEVLRLSAEINGLVAENEELRQAYSHAAAEVAFLPRLLTRKGNEVRAEMGKRVAELALQLANSRQELVAVTQDLNQQLQGKTDEVLRCRQLLNDAELRIIAERRGRAAEEDRAAALRAEAEASMEELLSARDAAEARAAEALDKRDRVLANAETELDLREARYRQEVATLTQSQAAREERLATQLQSLASDFQRTVQDRDEQISGLVLELAEAKDKLHTTEADNRELRLKLTLSTRDKNAALKCLRDRLVAEMDELSKQVARRGNELQESSAAQAAGIEKERRLAAELAAAVEAEQAARTMAMEAQTLIAALQKTLAEKDATIVGLQDQLGAQEEQSCSLGVEAHGRAVLMKFEGRRTTNEQLLSQAHQETVDRSFQAALAVELQKFRAAEEALRAEAAAEVSKLRHLITANADVVLAARETQRRLDAATARIAELEGAAEVDKGRSVGAKRPRRQ